MIKRFMFPFEFPIIVVISGVSYIDTSAFVITDYRSSS